MYYSLAAFGFVLTHALGKPSRATMAKLLLAIAMVHAPFLAIALYAATLHDPSAPFVPPFFGNVRHLGYLGFLGGAASLAFLILDPRLRAVGMLLTVYALFGLLVLGSRGALISWVVSAAVLVLLSSQRKRIMWVAQDAWAVHLRLDIWPSWQALLMWSECSTGLSDRRNCHR